MINSAGQEEQLRDSVVWIKKLSNSAFEIDSKGIILAWNGGMEQLTGIGAAKTLGMPCRELSLFCDSQGRCVCDQDCPIHQAAKTMGSYLGKRHVYLNARNRAIPVSKTVFISRGSESTDRVVHVVLERVQEMWPSFGLTPSEMRVLRYMCQGYSTEEIATGMNITYNTVRTHIRNVLSKLGVHKRMEAVSLAMGEYAKLPLEREG
ncbi:helix-turn-helix transcriptional regulator [Paenibacillus sp. Marseille-P2973]|uniref:helix-turn-helix domain-containing protein n=1 Tax=Paenibacillus sp. Marseille-P2973 TaxID=1871032 RepID=UPI001B3871B6|nr:helix-turn-helix transcriptional regulator [Paenibacillus sp. Marseille-P2973]MBQ4899121.1 helix-turn-helix transcriptional regulator [Paenibacillus sp. Marseille-P2973]